MRLERMLLLAVLGTGCSGTIGGAGEANTQTIDGPVQAATAPGKYRRASFGDDALARAQLWVDQNVMYSFSPNYAGYRTDCSGLVSWAWKLDAPGHTTYSFAGGPWDDGASYQIGWDELQPGDALNYPGNVSAGTGHIFLFAGWADAAHYGFYVYEEYNFGHPASYLYHTLDTNWTGGRVRDQYIPIRAANRPANSAPPPESPPPEAGGPDLSCGDLGYEGACRSSWLVWTEGGACKVQDCAALGLGCGYQDAATGFNCL